MVTNIHEQERDAIIFLPGLGEQIDQSVEGMARRMANALDHNAISGAAIFNVKIEGRDSEYTSNPENNAKDRVYTISRIDNNQEVAVADVFTLDYRMVLTRRYKGKGVLTQGLRLLLVLLTNLHRYIGAFSPRRRQLDAVKKVQMLFATLILALLVVYLVILAVAVVQTVQQAPQMVALLNPTEATTEVQTDEPTPEEADASTSLTFAQFIVIVTAVIELFYPKIKVKLTDLATEYICAIEYLSAGSRRQVIAGQVASLFEHIAEKGVYKQVYIIAYSFGSLVALDTLFPAGNEPGVRLQQVHTLVTIGCPYDLVRVFWPNYFNERNARADVPRHWINVYAPHDVFASNFRKDRKGVEPDSPIDLREPDIHRAMPNENILYSTHDTPKALSFLAVLTLAGLQVHSHYWEWEYEAEVSSYHPVMVRLYQDSFALT